jgi:hypothetical protein
MIKDTDTARAIERMWAAYYALGYACNYEPNLEARVEPLREEIKRLMHELEGEE